jgi:hypothetical protein
LAEAAQRDWATFSLEAQRKAGQLLADMPKNPGGRGRPETTRTMREVLETETDSEAANKSHRWQQVAAVPQDAFASYLADTPEPTRAGLLRTAHAISPINGVVRPITDWSQDERDLRDQLTAGETVVVNMRTEAHNRLWMWAEQAGLAVRIDRTSIWGNPFLTPEDGPRDEVCDAFANHYWPHKPSLHKQLDTLRGKALGCWCAPARCHGDFLKAQADE